MNFDQKIVTYRELSLQEQYHAVHEFQSHDYQYISAPLFLGVFARLSRLYHFLIPRRKNKVRRLILKTAERRKRGRFFEGNVPRLRLKLKPDFLRRFLLRRSLRREDDSFKK